MRARLILLLSSLALAACGSATDPSPTGPSVDPTSVSAPDGPGAAPRTAAPVGQGDAGPSDGVSAPCVQRIRLANDILEAPPTDCRR